MNDVASGATLVTVGMAAVATVGGAVTAYFGYRTTRDKLEYDAERVQMRADIRHLTEKTDDCHRERDRLEARCDELEAEIANLRHRIDDASARHTALDRRVSSEGYDGPDTRRPRPAPE